MWKEERAEYLRNNRDSSWLFDSDINQEESRPRDHIRATVPQRHEDGVSLERQEYLERREKLKELERLKLKSRNGIYSSVSESSKHGAGEKVKSSGIGTSSSVGMQEQKKRNLPFNNFGSFFGPSEPVVSKRIIAEARAREEALRLRRLEAKEREPDRRVSGTRPPSSSSSHPRPVAKPKKVLDPATEKALALREARDYSFLFSDEPLDAAIEKKKPGASGSGTRPAPKEVPASKPTYVKPVSRDARQQGLASVDVAKQRRPGAGGGDRQTRLPPSSRPAMQQKQQANQRSHSQAPLGPASRPSSTGSKPTSATLKAKPVASVRKPGDARLSSQTALQGAKPVVRKPDTPMNARVESAVRKPPPPDQRRLPAVDQRRAAVPHSASRVPSRNVGNTQRRPSPPRPSHRPVNHVQESRRREELRRPQSPDDSDSFIDDEDDVADVSGMIRKMFGYNPNRYRDLDDGDDRDMEVGFSRIQAEERRSARIAREEDDRELEAIEEEERAEKLRKEKKRRRMS